MVCGIPLLPANSRHVGTRCPHRKASHMWRKLMREGASPFHLKTARILLGMLAGVGITLYQKYNAANLGPRTLVPT